MNQSVSLCELGTVEGAFSTACQTNCFQGEASALYDPCGNIISLVVQSTIHPSYDQPINGPIEFRIPEQGQWELKEQLANLTKVNTTQGEMGVSAASSADDDCGDEMCGGEFASTCTKTECDKLFQWIERHYYGCKQLEPPKPPKLELIYA